jgi:hypothetical protein
MSTLGTSSGCQRVISLIAINISSLSFHVMHKQRLIRLIYDKEGNESNQRRSEAELLALIYRVGRREAHQQLRLQLIYHRDAFFSFDLMRALSSARGCAHH